MSSMTELQTSRLDLRPWRAADADALLPILEANRAHLGPWIPARVAEPAPLHALRERLDEFGRAFADDEAWRFAVVARDTGALLGEIDLFPRNAAGRVAFADADRAELGYWLRADATGEGFVIESARAVLDAAAALGRFSHVEIRCDPRNAPSGAVARRLGFTLAATTDEPLEVWTSPMRAGVEAR